MIVIKSPSEIERMREAGRVVARVLDEVKRAVAPGVTTARLDETAEGLCRKLGALPAFKGYRGYPF
jgi:methionyl aminopeptidase